jgi:hypothetical protein
VLITYPSNYHWFNTKAFWRYKFGSDVKLHITLAYTRPDREQPAIWTREPRPSAIIHYARHVTIWWNKNRSLRGDLLLSPHHQTTAHYSAFL